MKKTSDTPANETRLKAADVVAADRYGSSSLRILNVNKVPAAALDSTSNVPPWDRAISDAM